MKFSRFNEAGWDNPPYLGFQISIHGDVGRGMNPPRIEDFRLTAAAAVKAALHDWSAAIRTTFVIVDEEIRGGVVGGDRAGFG